MKSDNAVQIKSYDFALRIIKIYKYLSQEKKEFVLSKQLLRSGTSIGANIEESIGGQSKADFFAKITIAYKETRESKYWI
jgi:four helix bundle protein